VKATTFEISVTVVRDGYVLGSYEWKKAIAIAWRRFLLNEAEDEVLGLIGYDTFSDGKAGGWQRGCRHR